MQYRIAGSWIAAALFSTTVLGGTATQVTFQSTALNASATYYVYKPANYDQQVAAGKQFAVIYALHWWGEMANCWSTDRSGRTNSQLDKMIDSVDGIICLSPQDNSYNAPTTGTSWWVDSPNPAHPDWKYSTFVSQDLVNEADTKYATIKDRAHRGLMGASMGGFGTLHNIRVHSDIFRVSYAIVALCDLRNYQIGAARACSYGTCWAFGNTSSVWTPFNPMQNITGFAGKDIILTFQSGNCSPSCPSPTQADLFYSENTAFDAALTAANVPHTFNNYADTGHDFPVPSRMVQILKYFQNAFNSVPVLPETKKTVRAQSKAGAKAHLVLLSAKNGSISHDNYVGINGKKLETIPTSGIAISTK